MPKVTKIVVGDDVKILIGIERVWIKVTNLDSDTFTGTLNNILIDPDATLEYGDEIVVNRDEVLEVFDIDKLNGAV